MKLHKRKKKKKRKSHTGEYTCNCGAYSFPHRFSGGRCSLRRWVDNYWSECWGGGNNCGTCNSFVDGHCEVVVGQEAAKYCNALQEFVIYNSIRVKGIKL